MTYQNEKPEPLDERDLETRFDEFFDEINGNVKIGSLDIGSASRVLAEVDPTAYRTCFNDWLDSETRDGSIVEDGGEYFDRNDFESWKEDAPTEGDES